jgi:hypothetical protein
VLLRAQVKNFERFRRSLPADAKLYVAKNTLLRLAADRVEGWSELKQARSFSFTGAISAISEAPWHSSRWPPCGGGG